MLIFAGLRSPFGRNAGGLAGIRPDDLAAQVIAALISQVGVEPSLIEDVVLGCSNQAGEDSRNVARHAALLAGLPVSVAGVTINRLCGSGLAAVLDAGRMAATGAGDLFIAGGVESMTRGPFAVAKAEKPYSRDFRFYDTSMGARFPNPRLAEQYGEDSMPQTAENVARELGISRAECDAYTVQTQTRCEAARASGFFGDELCPIRLPAKRDASPSELAADEHPRPGTTLEQLQRLKPLFAEGVVTAGNASGINDGAAAMLIGNERSIDRLEHPPRARILTSAVAGVEPRLMGLGPVPASRKALDRAGLALNDLDLIEINEAFAAQVLGCAKQLGLAVNDSRLNPNGGAIAIGHPLGASGARLVLTALRELERRQGRYALVSMCIGVGQGIAAVIERLDATTGA